MPLTIRPVTQADVPFLWEMLYHAARMSEDGSNSPEDAKHDPHLNIYVHEWGRHSDRGVIAYSTEDSQKLGAAWLRLLTEDKSHYGYHDDETPELAIAVQPEATGQGIGSALLSALIEQVKTEVPAIVLTVRSDNPAKKLYEHFGFVTINEVTNRVGTSSSKMLLRFR